MCQKTSFLSQLPLRGLSFTVLPVLTAGPVYGADTCLAVLGIAPARSAEQPLADGHQAVTPAVKFSGNGARFTVTGKTSEFSVHDSNAGEVVGIFPSATRVRNGDNAISYDGTKVAAPLLKKGNSFWNKSSMEIFDVDTKTSQTLYTYKEKWAKAVQFSADEKQLIVEDANHEFFIFRIDKKAALVKLGANGQNLRGPSFLPDGRIIASRYDLTFHTFDSTTGKTQVTRTFDFQFLQITGNKVIAHSLGQLDTIVVWNRVTGVDALIQDDSSILRQSNHAHKFKTRHICLGKNRVNTLQTMPVHQTQIEVLLAQTLYTLSFVTRLKRFYHA